MKKPFFAQIFMLAVLVLPLALALTGCQTASGYGNNPWERYNASHRAEQAPNRLTKDARLPPAETAQPVTETNQYYDAFEDPKRYRRVDPENRHDPSLTAPEGMGEDSQHADSGYFSVSPHEQQPSPHGAAGTGYSNRYGADPHNTATAPVRVALLVPLSGEKAPLGKAMLNAAQMALFDIGFESFELIPRDTKGTPHGAQQAAQSAVDAGAQLVLGPLFASSVRAAKPVTSRARINMMAFSTDWTLAGGNTYIMGFLPFAQVARIADFAAQKGIFRVGVLAPDTHYGNAVVSVFRPRAMQNGIMVSDTVKFSAEDNNISPIVRTFTDYDERVELLNQQIRPLKARIKANPNDTEAQLLLAELEKMSSWGESPFDAVLMPVGGDQARSISNLLSFYDLAPDKVRRLGTGLWDDEALAAETNLEGAWFAAPSPKLRTDFETRYRQIYGINPPRLASLAYDATSLATVLGRSGVQQYGRPAFHDSALTNPNGFSGIDGIFRFRPDGLIERGLAVLEYRNGQIIEIDPAPTTFQDLRY